MPSPFYALDLKTDFKKNIQESSQWRIYRKIFNNKRKKHKIYEIFYFVLQKLQIKVGINSIT